MKTWENSNNNTTHTNRNTHTHTHTTHTYTAKHKRASTKLTDWIFNEFLSIFTSRVNCKKIGSKIKRLSKSSRYKLETDIEKEKDICNFRTMRTMASVEKQIKLQAHTHTETHNTYTHTQTEADTRYFMKIKTN